MPLDLTLRQEVSSDLTAEQYDATLNAIQTFANNLEAAIAALQASVTALSHATLPGVTPVANGGTGSSTAAAARLALRVPDAGPSGSDITLLWRGPQSAYDAIATKSATTLYIITG